MGCRPSTADMGHGPKSHLYAQWDSVRELKFSFVSSYHYTQLSGLRPVSTSLSAGTSLVQNQAHLMRGDTTASVSSYACWSFCVWKAWYLCCPPFHLALPTFLPSLPQDSWTPRKGFDSDVPSSPECSTVSHYLLIAQLWIPAFVWSLCLFLCRYHVVFTIIADTIWDKGWWYLQQFFHFLKIVSLFISILSLLLFPATNCLFLEFYYFYSSGNQTCHTFTGP